VDFRGLIARRHVLNTTAIGSVGRGEDHQASDVDFLVGLSPGASLLEQVHLEVDLRSVLDCDVGVVPVGGLKPRDQHLPAKAVPL
jgi:predicted nucleotidyltransferase